MSNVWPPSLPESLLHQGYQERQQDNVLRNPTDVGPSLTRRRDTATVTNVKGNIIVTKAQYSTFQTFFSTTLKDGSLEFDWTHPITGASVSFMFTETPTITPVGPEIYRIAMSLEIQP